jgi:hypothetical protein
VNSNTFYGNASFPNVQPSYLLAQIQPGQIQELEAMIRRVVAEEINKNQERAQKIEDAARTALEHLNWLDKCGNLTREEEPMLSALREALQ